MSKSNHKVAAKGSGILDVAIVGAGIAGLYSCWEIRKWAERTGRQIRVPLFDAAGEVGGRIESHHWENNGGLTSEFGPMRIVPDRQPRLTEGRHLSELMMCGSCGRSCTDGSGQVGVRDRGGSNRGKSAGGSKRVVFRHIREKV